MVDDVLFNFTNYEIASRINNTTLSEYGMNFDNPTNVSEDIETFPDEYLIHLIKTNQKVIPVYCYMVMCVTGLFATVMNLFVFTRKSMCSSSLNAILIILELANVVFLVIYFQSTILRLYFVDYMLKSWYNIWMKLLACLCMPFMTFFNMMTVLINIWRIISIKHPLKAKRLLRPKQAVIFTLILLSASFGLNCYNFIDFNGRVDRNLMLKFFSLRSTYNPKNAAYLETKPNLKNHLTMMSYTVGYLIPLLCCLISVIYLAYNLYLIKKKQGKLREGQTSKELKQTFMVMFLLVGFLLSYANPMLLFAQQYFHPGTFIVTPLCLGMCLPVLIIANLNFFVYLTVSGNFRRTFRDSTLSVQKSFMKMVSNRQ